MGLYSSAFLERLSTLEDKLYSSASYDYLIPQAKNCSAGMAAMAAPHYWIMHV
jgi:hypothetical protein